MTLNVGIKFNPLLQTLFADDNHVDKKMSCPYQIKRDDFKGVNNGFRVSALCKLTQSI
jgi:hypothetical protein